MIHKMYEMHASFFIRFFLFEKYINEIIRFISNYFHCTFRLHLICIRCFIILFYIIYYQFCAFILFSEETLRYPLYYIYRKKYIVV